MIAGRSNAFSLLELVLVLVIIGIALATVTPSLSGWSRGMKLRTQGDELLAATRFARDRAATAATPCALIASEGGSGWRVEEVDPSALPLADVPPSGASLLTYALPAGFSIAIESPTGQPMERATFYPDGRGEPAVLTLTNDRGEWERFERESVASGFLRVSEVRR